MIKTEVLKMIGDMPDDISISDIMYKLYILDKHSAAMSDIENRRVYESDDVRRAIAR